jgi:AcrR family transcriptional regulator
MTTTRESISAAAFHLFGTQGYEDTSVDDIASAAGVSRSTFFRLYGTKEAVIFPDHDKLLRVVEDRLAASSSHSAIAAVTDAVKLVLFHYIAEGERARERYGLTSSVTPLRERELISSARYQRLFRRFISAWGDGSRESELRAELMASAVVAAHNRTLRRWLRDETDDPQIEINAALAAVNAIFDQAGHSEVGVMLVVREGVQFDAVVDAVRSLRAEPSNST